MKPLGYIIYFFWDVKHKGPNDEEWQTIISQPMIEFKKKVYDTKEVAEEAISQMKKIDYFNNASYHILPIFTPLEEHNKVVTAYKERLKQPKKD